MKNNLEQIFDFLHLMQKIKTNQRFKDSPKIPKESISDHTWRLSLMVILFVSEMNLKIDQLKAIKIAIVHDITESITDDIDFALIDQGKVSKSDKHINEVKAIKEIKKMLPPKISKEVYDLWHEYENAKTNEAKFIKALDKIETLTIIYEAGYRCYSNPKACTYYAVDHVNNYPVLKPVYNEIKKRLKKR